MSADPPDWCAAAEAYDALAARYDRIPRENRVNRVLRARSLARLRSLFREGQRVLEIGCGTGEEALELAASGVRIVAVDPSEQMVRLTGEKARDRGLHDRISVLRGRASEISRAGLAAGSFDGAYASFSLAYEPDLRPVAEGLHGLLRRDARFAVSVPSRVCLVEWLAALVTARPSVAGRRLRPWHGHTVAGRSIPIRTFTPRGLAAEFSPAFRLVRWEALVGLVPPPGAARWYGRLDGLADGIERLDERVRRGPLRSVGDHFLAEFSHASEPPA